jgi:hypothetical protein
VADDTAAEDLRERIARALAERTPSPIPWETVLAFDTLRECRDRYFAEADAVLAVLAALAGDPGDVQIRVAAAILQARFGDEMPSASQLIDAVRDAAAAMSVRWGHAASQAAEVERLRAELTETRAEIGRAERLRDKWLTYPRDDMHYAAGLMLDRHLSGKAFAPEPAHIPGDADA